VNVPYPIDATDGYEPQLDEIDQTDIDQAKMLLLNYPSNPTSATVDFNVFMKAVTFAKDNNMIVANDAAYDLVTFGDYVSPSILQVPNAKEHAVEFGSLSKSFNMTGWRIGYIVGNKDVIQSLATLKSNLDSSQFIPIQLAAATALTSDLSHVRANNKIIEERMEKVCQALDDIGIRFKKPRGTIFVWAEVPKGYTSASFAELLLEEAGIIVTPGSAFGSGGEGYFRIALTVTKEKLDEVVKRLQQIQLLRDRT